MNRKISLLSIFLAAIVIATVSCSSGDKNASEEQPSSDVAEATADATNGATDAQASTETPPTDPANASDMAATETPPADPNAPPAADEFASNEANKDVGALDDPNAKKEEAPPADPNAVAAAEPSPAPEAAPAPETAAAPAENNDLFGGAAVASTDAGAGEEKPKKLPLAHIKDKPFKKGGQLLNTVYIAREGDTLEGVSEKLFGENKTKELKKANPSLKKNMKPGEKVYFNSPNRPEDNERMMTVYEDQGLPPTSYTTKEGDTLKALSMEWYGTEASYKEVYAINRSLASPTELAPGTELQYWPASVSVIAYNAAKKEETVAQAPAVPDLPPAAAAPPTPAPANVAANTAPPPPAGGNNMLPPPPPDLNTPALPPPPAAMSKKKPASSEMDKDTVMYAVAAGVLLIGGGGLVAIRRRNARRNQGVTQI